MMIYCDLDDTLVDFFESAERALAKHGHPEWHCHSWTEEGDKWQAISKEKNFWRNLPWAKDGKALWNFISPYKPHILSAVTRFMDSCRDEKLIWIQKNLSINKAERIHLVSRKEKKNFAISRDGKPNILIDDYSRNCEEFIAAGGIAILHKSAAQTIRELKNLLG
jgi:5'(3')-deoxyribonucleotidase